MAQDVQNNLIEIMKPMFKTSACAGELITDILIRLALRNSSSTFWSNLSGYLVLFGILSVILTIPTLVQKILDFYATHSDFEYIKILRKKCAQIHSKNVILMFLLFLITLASLIVGFSLLKEFSKISFIIAVVFSVILGILPTIAVIYLIFALPKPPKQ